MIVNPSLMVVNQEYASHTQNAMLASPTNSCAAIVAIIVSLIVLKRG